MTLSGRLNIQTRNPDVLSEAITALVSPCIAIPQTDGTLDYSGNFVGWSDFALGEAGSKSGLTLKTLSPAHRIICGVSTSGTLTYKIGSRDLKAKPGEAVICDSYIVDSAFFSENYAQFFLTTSLESINEYARNKFGTQSRMLFGNYSVLPRSHMAAAALSGFGPLIEYLLRDKDLLAISPIKLRRCHDAFIDIISSALHSEGIFVGSGEKIMSGSLRHFHDAELFMASHAKEPIGVTEVAEAVGLSQRSLQLIFRKYAGSTPLQRLQRIRLEGLRRDLEDQASTDWRIMAATWGFVSAPRVMKQYFSAFGETPKQTLDKNRK